MGSMSRAPWRHQPAAKIPWTALRPRCAATVQRCLLVARLTQRNALHAPSTASSTPGVPKAWSALSATWRTLQGSGSAETSGSASSARSGAGSMQPLATYHLQEHPDPHCKTWCPVSRRPALQSRRLSPTSPCRTGLHAGHRRSMNCWSFKSGYVVPRAAWKLKQSRRSQRRQPGVVHCLWAAHCTRILAHLAPFTASSVKAVPRQMPVPSVTCHILLGSVSAVRSGSKGNGKGECCRKVAAGQSPACAKPGLKD
mmetsp:Transcript_77039/g.178682  ORF Transcript_77039/g.178682 Transcript_77039/m.178682 type:complete len:255 (+) Transcript_77039:25-789(+)